MTWILCAVLAFSFIGARGEEPLDPGDEAVMRDFLSTLNFFEWAPYRTQWEDPCTWPGVACSGGRIRSICIPTCFECDMGFEDMGSLPPSIIQLTGLIEFRISCSYIPGRMDGLLPIEFFTGGLPLLGTLAFGGCQGLVTNVSEWSLDRGRLGFIMLDSNQVVGDISNLKCNVSAANTKYSDNGLFLNHNKITGAVPWNCFQLGLIDLSENLLTSLGKAGSDLCTPAQARANNITQYQVFLQQNQLQGSLEDIAPVLPCIWAASFCDNLLTGTVPIEMWAIPGFDISHNLLTGTLPDVPEPLEDTSGHTLCILASNNYLVGDIPSFPPTRTVALVDLSSNFFTGFGANFSNSSIEILQVSDNLLCGELPQLPNTIEELNVDGNLLSGCPVQAAGNTTSGCPDTHGLYPKLHSLHLARNNFSCTETACLPWWQYQELNKIDISYGNYNAVEIKSIYATSVTASFSGLGGNLSLNSLVLYADLSHNNFYGLLPVLPEVVLDSSGGIGSYTFSPGLIALDISCNRLEGGIVLNSHAVGYFSDAPISTLTSDLTSQLWSLQTLNITGNPGMRSDQGNAPFVPSGNVAFSGDDYSCAQLVIDGTLTTVISSPEFYDYKYCSCDYLFFGGASANGFHCTPLSAICADLACIDLANSTNNIVVASQGYFPRPSFNASTSVLPCPSNPSSKITYACAGQCMCVGTFSGTLNCSCDDLCSPGYEDIFCSRCEPGFYGLGLMCLACDERQTILAPALIASGILTFAVLTLVAIITVEPNTTALTGRCQAIRRNKLIVLFLLVVVLSVGISSILIDVSNMGIIGVAALISVLLHLGWQLSAPATSQKSTLPVDTVALSIIVTFVQTVTAMVPSSFFALEQHATVLTPVASVPPLRVVGPAAARSAGQLVPFGMECHVPNALPILTDFYITLALPFIFACLLVVTYGLVILRFKICRRTGSHEVVSSARQRTANAMVYLINYLVFNAFVAVIQVFNCEQIGSEEWYLLSTPWIQCFGDTWYQLLAIALAVMVGYIGAFSAIAWYMTHTVRHKGTDAVVARFSFLVSSFNPDRWWFSLVILLRRVVMAIGLSGFPTQSAVGPLTVIVALIAGLIGTTVAWPYQTAAQNWIEIGGLSILLVVYAAVVF